MSPAQRSWLVLRKVSGGMQELRSEASAESQQLRFNRKEGYFDSCKPSYFLFG